MYGSCGIGRVVACENRGCWKNWCWGALEGMGGADVGGMAGEDSTFKDVVGRIGQSIKERRNSKRSSVHGIWCDKGQVVDMSERGMRLKMQRRWQEGKTRKVTVSDDSECVTLDARCVWCRQEGLFLHAVGVAFDEVPDEKAKILKRVTASCNGAG